MLAHRSLAKVTPEDEFGVPVPPTIDRPAPLLSPPDVILPLGKISSLLSLLPRLERLLLPKLHLPVLPDNSIGMRPPDFGLLSLCLLPPLPGVTGSKLKVRIVVIVPNTSLFETCTNSDEDVDKDAGDVAIFGDVGDIGDFVLTDSSDIVALGEVDLER